MNNIKFYITTTLPYVNAAPHIGFALELVQADAIARFQKLLGKEVAFNTGTDEHGLKIYRKAKEEGKDPQEYCDENAAKFDALREALNLSYTNFIRTTDPNHVKAAQEFWKLCDKNGDIEKKIYRAKYCVGCELEKTDSELEDGKCPIHPNLKIEYIEEENYFFKFSNYQDELLRLYEQHPDFVLPKHRQKEIENFVKLGLRDFSVSRLKEKMPWGIEVPGDSEHVMYVWFDALVNYISTLGWPNDETKFAEYWPGVQVAGKDNLRQQSAMWQAMLMSAGLPPSKQVLIHGFITSGGQKMSKSLGNVVDPFEYVEKYGTDAVRYYLLAKVPTFEDGDFTTEHFEEVYNADLANGLGNLVARILTMAKKYGVENSAQRNDALNAAAVRAKDLRDMSMQKYQLDEAVLAVWEFISVIDKYIERNKPWELAKRDEDLLTAVIGELLGALGQVAELVRPFLPGTSEKISDSLGGKTDTLKPLFPRI